MPAKKGFFQKTDTKKQYSQNVLNNVEDAYRPKNRGRVRNPISSNTMSGEEEANDSEAPLTQMQDKAPQTRFKKPVGYAFAGPQAKRQKQDAQADASTPTQAVVNQPAAVVFSPPAQIAKNVVEEKSPEPEIQVRTGDIVAGPTLETSVALELMQAAIMLEAMQALEVDVQETRGNYEPLEESEVKAAKSLILQNLFSKTTAKSEAQYELDLDSISDLDSIAMDEFQQTEIVETQIQLEPRPTEEISAAECGLSFDPEAFGKDTKKTRFLNVPKQGIKRSHRGTIEAVFQPNGNIVQAQYNCCGILIEVNVGGAVKLTRAADTGKWTMSYLDGSQPVNRVKGVAFDRLGNLCYSTEDGRTTVICADGRVIEK